MVTDKEDSELTFGKSGVHRVFPVKEVSEFDVIDEAVVVDITALKQLEQLFVIDRHVELTTRLVEVFLRYQAFLILCTINQSINQSIEDLFNV